MLNRIREEAKTSLFAVAAVTVVASLTRFLFSHPICLVDMSTAFSSTGKFMKSTSRYVPRRLENEPRWIHLSLSLEYAES